MTVNRVTRPDRWLGQVPTVIPDWLARCAADSLVDTREMAKLMGTAEDTLRARVNQDVGPELPPSVVLKCHQCWRRYWRVKDVRNWIHRNAREAAK